MILEHGGGISTLYGHMSRFAKGMRNGQRVRQGDTIGYVGSSGAATGPHLHYEYRVNGVHKNPRTVPLPDAAPIPAEYMAEFQEPLGRSARRLDRAARLRPSQPSRPTDLHSLREARCNTSAEPRSILGAPLSRRRMLDVNLKAPEHYINRELSFLDFNYRVLAQAHDESLPLLERIRFLGISCSNLDEFFEIRVAGLKQRLELGSLGRRAGRNERSRAADRHPRARRWPWSRISTSCSISWSFRRWRARHSVRQRATR